MMSALACAVRPAASRVPKAPFAAAPRRAGGLRVPAARRSAARRAPAAAPACYADAQPAAAAAVGGSVPVTFSVQLQVGYGEHVLLLGSEESLGGWELGRAVEMSWGEGDVWSATVSLPVGATCEFKFVHQMPGQAPVWEPCQNRGLTAPAAAASVATAWNVPEVSLAVDDSSSEGEGMSSGDELLPPAFKPDVSFPFLGGEEEGAAAAAVNGFAAMMAGAQAAAASAFQAPVEGEAAQLEAAALAAQSEVEGGAALDGSSPASAETLAPAGNQLLQSVGKTAAGVALAVAGGVALSALAIDITDMALMGAIVAGAASLGSNSGSSKAKGGPGGAAATEEEKADAAATAAVVAKPSAPGVFLAASVLSATEAMSKAFGGGGKVSQAAALDVASSSEDSEDNE